MLSSGIPSDDFFPLNEEFSIPSLAVAKIKHTGLIMDPTCPLNHPSQDHNPSLEDNESVNFDTCASTNSASKYYLKAEINSDSNYSKKLIPQSPRLNSRFSSECGFILHPLDRSPQASLIDEFQSDKTYPKTPQNKCESYPLPESMTRSLISSEFSEMGLPSSIFINSQSSSTRPREILIGNIPSTLKHEKSKDLFPQSKFSIPAMRKIPDESVSLLDTFIESFKSSGTKKTRDRPKKSIIRAKLLSMIPEEDRKRRPVISSSDSLLNPNLLKNDKGQLAHLHPHGNTDQVRFSRRAFAPKLRQPSIFELNEILNEKIRDQHLRHTEESEHRRNLDSFSKKSLRDKLNHHSDAEELVEQNFFSIESDLQLSSTNRRSMMTRQHQDKASMDPPNQRPTESPLNERKRTLKRAIIPEISDDENFLKPLAIKSIHSKFQSKPEIPSKKTIGSQDDTNGMLDALGDLIDSSSSETNDENEFEIRDTGIEPQMNENFSSLEKENSVSELDKGIDANGPKGLNNGPNGSENSKSNEIGNYHHLEGIPSIQMNQSMDSCFSENRFKIKSEKRKKSVSNLLDVEADSVSEDSESEAENKERRKKKKKKKVYKEENYEDENEILKELIESGFIANDCEETSNSEDNHNLLMRQMEAQRDEDETRLLMNRFLPDEVLESRGPMADLLRKYGPSNHTGNQNFSDDKSLKPSMYGRLEGLKISEKSKHDTDFSRLMKEIFPPEIELEEEVFSESKASTQNSHDESEQTGEEDSVPENNFKELNEYDTELIANPEILINIQNDRIEKPKSFAGVLRSEGNAELLNERINRITESTSTVGRQTMRSNRNGAAGTFSTVSNRPDIIKK